MKKMTPQEEADVLVRLKKGESEAFSCLFYAYKDKLFDFAFNITRSQDAAEDIVQDVFLKVWKNHKSVAEADNFNAFIYRAAKNQAIDFLRKASRENFALSHIIKTIDLLDRVDPFECLKASETRDKIDLAVSKLPRQQRIVYQMHHIEGVKHDEIATRLNVSVSTIRNHLMFALTNLKRVLILLPTLVFFY